MFQYEFGSAITDSGRTEKQIKELLGSSGKNMMFAWSADGVRVAVDAAHASAVAEMTTAGDAVGDDNIIKVAGAVETKVTAAQFNALRTGGFFEQLTLSDWKISEAERLTGDNAYLNLAVLSAPTHDLVTWGNAPTADRLTVLRQALRIAFTTWAQDYNSRSVYVFAAPEYYFGGNGTHFLEAGDAAAVTEALTNRLRLLPDNYVVIPGSAGSIRKLNGQAAREYYTRHAEHHEALREEMTANGLSEEETGAQEELWSREPKMAQEDDNPTAIVYSNTATIFRGQAEPVIYSKRYESDDSGGAPDRTETENQNGYFDIGQAVFAIVVNGLTIRLEICADNAYESIKSSGYDGLHVVIASDFGDVYPNTIHGQAYAHVDSSDPKVSTQQTADAVTTRRDAGERELRDIAAQQTASRKVGEADCRLTLHQLVLPN